MINLIPNEEKERMVKDFYLRLVVVSFVMLGVSFFVASLAILPAYILSSAEKNFIDSKLKSQENETIPLPDKNTLEIVQDLEDKLNLVEHIKPEKLNFSQRIITEVVLKKLPNIRITEIFYQNDPQKGELINVSGRAPSREVLLSFRRALEDSTAFLKVNLPISNFVKGSDIRFNLSLIPL